MAMRRPDFGAEQDSESIFEAGEVSTFAPAEGLASPFVVGGTVTSPFESATDISTEAETRRAAAEGVLAQTESEIRAAREEEAAKGMAKEIGMGAAHGAGAGAITGTAAVPGIGTLIGAIVGASGGLIGGGVAADTKHGEEAVREDVEKAVAATGQEVAVAEAEAVEQEAGLASRGLARAAEVIGQQSPEEPDVPRRRRMRAPTFTV